MDRIRIGRPGYQSQPAKGNRYWRDTSIVARSHGPKRPSEQVRRSCLLTGSDLSLSTHHDGLTELHLTAKYMPVSIFRLWSLRKTNLPVIDLIRSDFLWEAWLMFTEWMTGRFWLDRKTKFCASPICIMYKDMACRWCSVAVTSHIYSHLQGGPVGWIMHPLAAWRRWCDRYWILPQDSEALPVQLSTGTAVLRDRAVKTDTVQEKRVQHVQRDFEGFGQIRVVVC